MHNFLVFYFIFTKRVLSLLLKGLVVLFVAFPFFWFWEAISFFEMQLIFSITAYAVVTTSYISFLYNLYLEEKKEKEKRKSWEEEDA